MIPNRFSPQDFYFALAKSFVEDLRRLGVCPVDAEFTAVRRAVLGAITSTAVVVDGTQREYDEVKADPSGVVVLARFWLKTQFNNAATVYLFCRMVTGSPAGWQSHTLIFTQATLNPDNVYLAPPVFVY